MTEIPEHLMKRAQRARDTTVENIDGPMPFPRYPPIFSSAEPETPPQGNPGFKLETPIVSFPPVPEMPEPVLTLTFKDHLQAGVTQRYDTALHTVYVARLELPEEDEKRGIISYTVEMEPNDNSPQGKLRIAREEAYNAGVASVYDRMKITGIDYDQVANDLTLAEETIQELRDRLEACEP